MESESTKRNVIEEDRNQELEKFAATGKFTSYDRQALRTSMASFEGVGVVATVNVDGTPNAAIFVPVMPDDNHVALILAQNRTRANIERTGECVLVYDAMNESAEKKSDRHCGARLRLSLLDKECNEYIHVATTWERMNPAALIFSISEFMPVG